MTNNSAVLKIDTPENVTFDYDVAGIGSRFLAALVDTLAIFFLQIVILGTLLWLALRSSSTDSLFNSSAGYWVLGIVTLLGFIFFWGYYIFFEIMWNGQTLGKRWIGLRVIRLDGTPVTVTEVIIRNLVRMIDLLPAAYGVGVVTMFINENSRRLGDFAAGTLVVYDRSVTELTNGRSNRETELMSLFTYTEIPEGFPIERLTEKDIDLIEEFLLRRYQLPNREQLGAYILISFYTRFGISPNVKLSGTPDNALVAVYKAAQQHKNGNGNHEQK